jgi:cyclophilin family peptidyl-prolyl cis-trans isomerase/protein-disulfide isomerase
MIPGDNPRVRRRASRRVSLRRSALVLAVGLLATGCASLPSTPTAPPTLWTPIALNPAATEGTLRPPTAAVPAGTILPTLAPIAPITEADFARGPAQTPITLLVYSDYQCATCADLAGVLSSLLALHPDDIRLVFRDFPLLPLYDKTSLATQAAASAAAQGDYWAMHDLLYARHAEWETLTPEQFAAWLPAAARSAGLDAAQLADDLKTRRYEPYVAEAYNRSVAEGIPGAPFLFFNRDLFLLPPTLENLEANVRLTLLAGKQFGGYPPMNLAAGVDYRARLRLNVGEIVIDLYEDSAPQAVNSFVFLAENHWYDGTPFYRVVRGQFVEAGDPSGTGFGTPGYSYSLETTPARRFDRPGVVGIDSDDPSTLGSRFFISLTSLPLFDPARTVLGQVTSGLDRLDALAARDPLEDLLIGPEAVILDVIIEIQ